MSAQERAFGWEDEIKNDGAAFTLLPAGTYPFVIVKFERARHEKSEKLPECNQANVFCKVFDPLTGNETVIKHQLYLHSKCESFICAFFLALGMRKHGEPLRMNWNQVVGKNGWCKLGVREGKDKNQYNEIKTFLDPADFPPVNYAPQQQQYQPTPPLTTTTPPTVYQPQQAYSGWPHPQQQQASADDLPFGPVK